MQFDPTLPQNRAPSPAAGTTTVGAPPPPPAAPAPGIAQPPAAPATTTAQPSPTTAQSSQTAVVEELDPDDDPPPGGLQQPGTQHAHKQIKIRPQSPVDESVLRIAKSSGKSITDPGVINAARALHNLPPLGTEPTAQPAPTTAQPSPTTGAAPGTVAECDQQMADLTRQIGEANANFLFERAAELDAQRETLRDRKSELRSVEAQASQVQAAQTQQAWTEANETAMQRFADLKVAASPLTIRANELQAAAIAAGGPMADFARTNPASILHFANEAAAALNIAPSFAPAPGSLPPAATAAPVTPVSPTLPSAAPPPLSALIAGPTTPASPPATTEKAQQFSTPQEYERWLASQSGSQYATPSFAAA